jgi:Tfp pilus assembly protein PilF
MPLVLVFAGLLAYHNSFTGTFIDDDFRAIRDNATIRHLWPIWECLSPPRHHWLTVEGRPLINLSLAVSYALSGYNVWGYHVINLVVHILAGLTLLGIVRRTLLQPAPIRSGPARRERFGAVANELALATAVLWTVHPLQTEAVTYIVQRAESIMGLFYFLTLYCFIRGTESPRSSVWYGLSVTACALGMASKEVMVSAPVMVMLYDRAFLSSSFREAWRRRWRLYLGLAATWILLGFLLVSAGTFTYESKHAQLLGATWWQYLATEPGVILYYLRLCVWPTPLCLNHPWVIVRTWASLHVLVPTVVVVTLLAATVGACWKRPVWGFVGAWFFLILAPTSSVIPLPDAIYEHRMYLSSAAVVSVVVMGLYSLLGRRSLVVFAALAIGLGFLTGHRNQDYQSEIAIRAAGVARFPNDPRTRYSLGNAFQRAGRFQEALEQYEQVIRSWSDRAWVHYDMANVLSQLGRMPEAIEHSEQAVKIWPEYVEAQNNLGVALANACRPQEAIDHFEQVLRLKPDDPDAHNNLGAALAQAGRLQEAADQFEAAVRARPDDPDTQFNLGNALLGLGQVQEAMQHYEEALRLKPDFIEAEHRLAALRAGSGKRESPPVR